MDKQALSTELLSRAANISGVRGSLAGKAKEIASVHRAMGAMRGKVTIPKGGVEALERMQHKALRQKDRFTSALSKRSTNVKLAAMFDELEKIGSTVLMPAIPKSIKAGLDAQNLADDAVEIERMRPLQPLRKQMNKNLKGLPLVGAAGEYYEEALPKAMRTGGGSVVSAETAQAGKRAAALRKTILDRRLAVSGNSYKAVPGFASRVRQLVRGKAGASGTNTAVTKVTNGLGKLTHGIGKLLRKA